jgi:tRNA pseudouridine38-40 synthase
MQHNYKLTVSYDGTRYYGWQAQPDKTTIQGKIQSVLNIMCSQEVLVIGAGRTDAGVHARAMTANVHMDTPLSEDEIRDYLNKYLPEDIAVTEVKIASDRFHARYNALTKTYRYTCYCGNVKSVFDRKYILYLDKQPDIDKMQQAAQYILGEHDFKSFCGNSKFKKSTVRRMDDIDIRLKRGYLYITFTGSGFLQNMVRILVGTLLDVGFGKIAPDELEEIIAGRDRLLAGPTVPPQGLCLMKVNY